MPAHRAERALLLAATGSVAAWTAMDGSPAGRIARAAVVVLAGALAFSRLPEHQIPRGGVLLVFGVPATAIGSGIAPTHLAKEGGTPEAVIALLALLCGLALLVAGIRDLTAGQRGAFRHTVAVAGSTVALLTVLFLVVPGIAAVNVPRTAADRTPAAVGLRYEDVWFPTVDGVRLHGWYVPSANGAAVVVRHGSGSTSSSTLAQAAVLARHGFGVLLTDARGHGRSEGRAMDFGWYGDRDIRAAIDFLLARPDVRPDAIGGLGLSMGGEELLGAGGSDERLRAIVAEGATGRTAADHDWFSDAYGWRGWIQERLDGIQSSFTDALTPATPPTPLLDAVLDGPPTLLIAAGTVPDEREVATRLEAVRPDGVRRWVVPDASHTGGLAADRAGWEARVVAFFDAALSG